MNPAERQASDGKGAFDGYNNGLLLPLCNLQNGYCLARTFRRLSVSSSGGGIGEPSCSIFERGCLTILAVGSAVSDELAGGVVTETTLGFIW
jgi:hypothetical protein